ncbi:hypothetical protein [Hymenobacter crusticola]|uniref:Beta-carotene 15,15'-monooxygenase n=1 Tax=Hymenobacter crusticola TaxID=1770526 RepID=A0A243W5G3_9BACT|nr:hypothetical protein [Hymenobacter crusticola]OUJ68683.1 hypothetical protein BXP70_27545 [Hymenobacter crusticola]
MTVTPSLTPYRPALWFAALILLVLGVEYTITTSARFPQQVLLPVAVTLDVLVGIPVLFYALILRRYHLPLSSLVGVVGICWALVYWLLPVAQQAPLQILHYLPALLESITLLLLVARARQLVRAYRAAYAQQPQFWPCAQLALQHTLGLAGVLLVSELLMLRYALLGWWARPELPAEEATAFSSHRESGFTAYAVMVGVALAIETAVVHLLVRQWSTAVAGWLLLLECYTLVVLLAHIHAVRLRPTLVSAATLQLHVGFVWQLEVPLSDLVAIEPLRDHPAPAADLLPLTKLLFTSPNLLLTFAQPVTVHGAYGIQRTARRVALYVDHPHRFIQAIELS